MIGFAEAVSLFYRNYVNFEGRSSRAEYWWPVLMQVLVYSALLIGFLLFVGFDSYAGSSDEDTVGMAFFIAAALFALFNFLPSIAVKVRRFHDLDQTGWLVLVFWGANLFIPLVEFARMIWFAFPGTEGPNQYGPDPYRDNADIFG